MITNDELIGYGFTGLGKRDKTKVKFKDVKDDMTRKEFRTAKKERKEDAKNPISEMDTITIDAKGNAVRKEKNPFTLEPGFFDKLTDTVNKTKNVIQQIKPKGDNSNNNSQNNNNMADESMTTAQPWYKNKWVKITGATIGGLIIAGIIYKVVKKRRARK